MKTNPYNYQFLNNTRKKERKKTENTVAPTTLAALIILVPSAADEKVCMTAVATLFVAVSTRSKAWSTKPGCFVSL